MNWQAANGLRYPRWGGRRDAIRLGKCSGVEKGLESRQNPQRRVHALFGGSMNARLAGQHLQLTLNCIYTAANYYVTNILNRNMWYHYV